MITYAQVSRCRYVNVTASVGRNSSKTAWLAQP